MQSEKRWIRLSSQECKTELCAKLQRRRAVENLARARGEIEDARFERLRELKASLDQFQQLDDEAKQNVLKALKQSELNAEADFVAELDQEIAEKKPMVSVELTVSWNSI